MDDLSDREQEMLLRALREYSEACEAPELTPGCPFAVDIQPNLRGCGEECMDLLGQHAAPRPERGIALDSGFIAHMPVRPRARRPQQVNPKPYDAKEIYFRDREMLAVEHWSLPALLFGAVETLTSAVSEDEKTTKERVDHIHELLDGVESHNIDCSLVVEPEVRFRIVGSMISEVFHMVGQSDDPDLESNLSTWLPVLHTRLHDLEPHSRRWHQEIVDAILPTLVSWSIDAPFSEIINWSPPASLAEQPLSKRPQPRDPSSAWILDRFMTTYLHEWKTDSLRLEWKYLHGELQVPCSQSDLRLREIPEDDLSKAMADRLVRYEDNRPSLMNRLKPSAIRYLREGRHERAAILFETAIDQNCADAEGHNNLGFCLIPTDPNSAVESLERAMSMGWSEKALTDANRILATAFAGRLTSALDLALTYSSRHGPSELQGHHYLWDPTALLDRGEPELLELDDLDHYVDSIVNTLLRRMSN